MNYGDASEDEDEDKGQGRSTSGNFFYSGEFFFFLLKKILSFLCFSGLASSSEDKGLKTDNGGREKEGRVPEVVVM